MDDRVTLAAQELLGKTSRKPSFERFLGELAALCIERGYKRNPGLTVSEMPRLFSSRERSALLAIYDGAPSGDQLASAMVKRGPEAPPAGDDEPGSGDGDAYLDFELRVLSDNTINASSDVGDQSGTLQLDSAAVDPLLRAVAQGSTSADMLASLGTLLYDALFPIRVHGLLQATLARAEGGGHPGVRVRLIVDPPEVASLPWEFLYDSAANLYLANSPQTLISRFPFVPASRRDLRHADPPLKILLVVASPEDLPQLSSEGEERLIRQALQRQVAAGQVEIDVERKATTRNIRRRLQDKAYNVLHFSGHGGFDGDAGTVVLVNEQGRAKGLNDVAFAEFFVGNNSLGLVVLTACQGAATSTHDALSGIAPQLAQRGIPAVIAMRYEVFNATVSLFAEEFYHGIALGWPVDRALQATRNAISQEVGRDQRDFATPVLFLRAKSGVLFRGLRG